MPHFVGVFDIETPLAFCNTLYYNIYRLNKGDVMNYTIEFLKEMYIQFFGRMYQ